MLSILFVLFICCHENSSPPRWFPCASSSNVEDWWHNLCVLFIPFVVYKQVWIFSSFSCWTQFLKGMAPFLDRSASLFEVQLANHSHLRYEPHKRWLASVFAYPIRSLVNSCLICFLCKFSWILITFHVVSTRVYPTGKWRLATQSKRFSGAFTVYERSLNIFEYSKSNQLFVVAALKGSYPSKTKIQLDNHSLLRWAA